MLPPKPYDSIPELRHVSMRRNLRGQGLLGAMVFMTRGVAVLNWSF